MEELRLREGRRFLWIIVAATAACLLLVQLAQWLQWFQPSGESDLVTGAQGPFPAAFGPGAPVAPEHVMRRRTGERVLVHGLSVESTTDGARAVNLRTGKEYWRYERQDESSVAMSFDVSERTVVIAYWGTLVGVDLRTGKRLWREDLGDDEAFRSVSLGAGQALTAAPGAVRAFDERDGRSLWTVRTPKSCPAVGVHAVYVLPDHVSAVPLLCNLASLDTDTGRPLHTLRLPAMTAPDDDVYFMKLDVQQVTDGAPSLSWRELSTDEQLITD